MNISLNESDNEDGMIDHYNLSQHPEPATCSDLKNRNEKTKYSELCDITTNVIRSVIHYQEQSENVLFLKQRRLKISFERELLP